MGKIALVLILLALSVSGNLETAWTQEPEAGPPPASLIKTIPDLALVRPLAAMAAVLPSSAFLATIPLTCLTGIDLKASEVLAQKPWGYVSNRPLGVFIPEEKVTRSLDQKINQQYSEFLGRTAADPGNPLDMR